MADTLFADVSEYQPVVDDRYPYRVLSIRSNDGTYRDRRFAANYAWAKKALAAGKLDALIVYFVWETNWLDAVNTHKAMVGATPHPKMATMIDIESWGGKIRGNQSVGINAAREKLISWYGGNRRRVIGYANAGDFANLWPTRGDCNVILANYSANPSFPRKIAHQFSSSFAVPPFGRCDINSADGLTPAQFAAVLGIGVTTPRPAPTPASAPAPKPTWKERDMLVVRVDPATVPKGADAPTLWRLKTSTGLDVIDAPSGKVNNGANLLKALGQAAPCTITYEQYVRWGGK